MKNTSHTDLQFPRLTLQNLLKTGFEEDLGFGDISSAILPDKLIKGEFIAKSDGIISGIDSILIGYQILDETVEVQHLVSDGDYVEAGECIARVDGPVRALLTSERVILNILQHLSGIATKTFKAVKEMGDTSTRICDTRKTLPGLRALQKYAVRCGGGYNHRMRLDDGVMIKDNHIAAAGSITKAMETARGQNGLMVKIEVECETEDQVKEAIKAGADIIMLDNQTPESAAQLCAMIPDNIIVELSGGMTPETVGEFKDCGAHYISMGCVTHSVTALDISFVLTGAIKNV
ncbi:carboxylating nicotinate-nucleotide diphosphorylase [Rhodohalobacter sp. SW132]|uniref:carboxylating nicotinate-nucleotide diphosphorylase n=1 Tax=Rhodohalobacter sp. SW132 TaxID=2293433 RepID=UPI000E25720A|nr:carboxylating nicotinate-nucleotide diphosphorylase [Rhodohalobacter sp. SW132]REL24785.1 carboxylating nicotinate-nucleotide diphosphorylase [Rhodohalobacter sp. SW132]